MPNRYRCPIDSRKLLPKPLNHPPSLSLGKTISSQYSDIIVLNTALCECNLNSDHSCNVLDYLLFIQDWGRTDCP